MMLPQKRVKIAVAKLRDENRHHVFLRDALLFLGVLVIVLSFLFVSQLQARQSTSESLADLAERLQDAVVNISTSQKIKSPLNRDRSPELPKGLPLEKFFKDFFDKRREKRAQRVTSLGSGFVIDETGLIVTNNHVIKDADEIFVNFVDGTKLKVDKVLGRDAKTDLALLKVTPTKPLKSVQFGRSAKARVGDWVMAIGNPFGLGGTVTVGIVSAKNRDINSGPYDEFIQTDAAINRGNSGGPLFNMRGEVIGVNTAIISPSGGSIGIGFSVPSDTVVNVIDQLRQYGETRRGWLGVLIQKVTPDIAESWGMKKTEGALVARVTENSPAEKAGLLSGDIIINFDGQYVKSSRELPKIVALTPVDKTVDVKIMRQGKGRTVKVTIARLEEDKIKSPVNFEKGGTQDEEILGMTLSKLTPSLRRKYRINPKTKGVLVVKVKPNSNAAEKGIRPGNVIVDVMQQSVKSPADVIEKIEAEQKANSRTVVLYIASGRSEFRFVALPARPQG